MLEEGDTFSGVVPGKLPIMLQITPYGGSSNNLIKLIIHGIKMRVEAKLGRETKITECEGTGENN